MPKEMRMQEKSFQKASSMGWTKGAYMKKGAILMGCLVLETMLKRSNII